MIAASLKSVSVAIVIAAVSGCSTQVTLKDPTIPDPLIDKLPMSVAARFPETFEHFVHEEQVIGKKKWTIDMGRANSMLFEKLFGAMFTDFKVIGADAEPRDLGIDALIEPSIDAFEFSVPNQSQTDAFAVWIRYRIKIFDGGGNQIANWPISAYGKSMADGISNDDALRRAAVLAMRDAAALVILQMDKATGISGLSGARRGNLAAQPAETGEPEAVEAVHTTAQEELLDDSG
ncbi:MAG: hypothetical protein WD795_04195 [Woeseia sp.]